jgi:hypothetical protein
MGAPGPGGSGAGVGGLGAGPGGPGAVQAAVQAAVPP